MYQIYQFLLHILARQLTCLSEDKLYHEEVLYQTILARTSKLLSITFALSTPIPYALLLHHQANRAKDWATNRNCN